jgi:hypothetical protein
MPTLSPQAITVLIDQARRGDQDALNRLLPEVYGELRRIAARHMRNEREGLTLQATALVHEAYLRLFKDSALSFQNRAHFPRSRSRCAISSTGRAAGTPLQARAPITPAGARDERTPDVPAARGADPVTDVAQALALSNSALA